MNTLFDIGPTLAADGNHPELRTGCPSPSKDDKAFTDFRKSFYAARGTLLMRDEAWLLMQMRTGRSAVDAAGLTRLVLNHDFDKFCERLLAKGKL